MTSKRELQREVETLSEQTVSTDNGPMVMRLTYFGDKYNATPSREDSPHPELTVQPYPESRPESLAIAVPSILPEKYARRTWLFTVTCTKRDRYVSEGGTPEGAPEYVPPCEIWDSMTEAQLREERAHRERNDEQIPPILEPYAPE